MINLISELAALIITGLSFVWVINSIKLWWLNREVNKLSKEEREVFKKIDITIPEDVKNNSIKENLDFWNKQEKTNGD